MIQIGWIGQISRSCGGRRDMGLDKFRVRVADIKVRTYSDVAEQWWKEEHQQAMQCRDFLEVVELALFSYESLCRLDQEWKRSLLTQEAEYDAGTEARLNDIFAHWLEVSARLLQTYDQMQDDFARHGFDPQPLQQIEREVAKVQRRLQLSGQLAELATLQDRWLDGKGKAPPAEQMFWLVRAMTDHLEEESLFPYLYPTPAGEVQAEWGFGPHEVTLAVDLANQTGYWHWFNLDTDEEEEKTLELNDLQPDNDWPWVTSRLNQFRKAPCE